MQLSQLLGFGGWIVGLASDQCDPVLLRDAVPAADRVQVFSRIFQLFGLDVGQPSGEHAELAL